jgi:hypothetical protein
MKRYINTFLLFGSLALLIMWVDQVLYKGADFKDSYFFLMFSLAGFFYYLHRRGNEIIENKKNEESESKNKNNRKPKK